MRRHVVLRLIGCHCSLQPHQAATACLERALDSLELLHGLRWHQRRAKNGCTIRHRPRFVPIYVSSYTLTMSLRNHSKTLWLAGRLPTRGSALAGLGSNRLGCRKRRSGHGRSLISCDTIIYLSPEHRSPCPSSCDAASMPMPREPHAKFSSRQSSPSLEQGGGSPPSSRKQIPTHGPQCDTPLGFLFVLTALNLCCV